MDVPRTEPLASKPLRRDNAPHRGPLLGFIALIAVVSGSLSLFVLPALPAIILGGIVAWVAQRDLRAIARGDMDPQGEWLTHEARNSGILSILLGLLFLGMWGAMILFANYMENHGKEKQAHWPRPPVSGQSAPTGIHP